MRASQFKLIDVNTCLGDLPSWVIIGAVCVQCRRTGEVDRWALQRQIGLKAPLKSVEMKLYCEGCETAGRGFFVISKQRR